jgi:uncharacterized protein YbaR (Trm112 family)
MFSKPKACFNLTFKKINMINSECSICYDDVEKNNIIKTNCNHTYCISCFKQYLSVKSESWINTVSCPYCRQHIHCLSLNNEEEIQFMKNEFCNITKYANIFEPISVYVHNDIYNIATIGDFDLHDIPEVIVIYPIILYILLFMHVCFTLSIDSTIINILNKLIIVISLWVLFYKITTLYNVVNIVNYCFISWIVLCLVGIYTIIY